MPKYLDMHGLETLTGDIENTYLKKNQRGAAGGVASLDSNGKVPTSQIPGGAGGTTDYDDLTGKPQINGVTLSGNNTSADLGIANAENPVFTGSMSMGRAENTTVGEKSTATGTSVTASGSNAHAEGGGTTASGNQAHAEGGGTTASGTNAHSEGAGSEATNSSAHAEGTGTTASGDSSHSEGNGTTASGYGAHAEGSGTTASGLNAHAEGGATSATMADAHAEGEGTQANANSAHAEGSTTRANGSSSHSEGGGTVANGGCAHAEGSGTTANGASSHAEGGGTVANGACSHVGGRSNIPDDYSSWAEWTANTNYAVGDKVKRTVTENNETTVTGYICKTPNNDSTFDSSKWDVDLYMNYAEIIGNGSPSTPSNARTLDWDGNEELAGDLTINKGKANEVSVSELYKKPATGIPASDLESGTIPDPENLIDDTAGKGYTDKVWSADKSQEEIITKGRVKLLQDNEWGADRSATVTGRSYSVSKNVVTKAQASGSTAYRYALIFGGDTIKSPSDSNIETLFSVLDPTTDFIAIPAYQGVLNRNVILQFIVDLKTSTGGTANPEIFRIITADSQGNISEAIAVTIPQLNSKANKAKGIIEINLNDYAPSVLTNGKIAIVDYSRNSAWEGTVTVNLYLTPRFGNTVKDIQINGTSIVESGVANIPLPTTQSVSGSTPNITGVADTRYVCGECATLSVTAPASGCIDILFESGSTPTVLTVASAKTGVTDIKWMDGFDPDDLDADTIYEINILDGEFGVVAEWT